MRHALTLRNGRRQQSIDEPMLTASSSRLSWGRKVSRSGNSLRELCELILINFLR